MRKKLIVALAALSIILICAVGVLVFLEMKPAQQPDVGSEPETTTAVETTAAETEEPTEVTEETVGISLPTEDPNEVAPEATFSEEDEVPPVTVDPDVPATTEDPDANETPEFEF